MQILLALIAGTVIGIAVHFVVPDRDTRGVVLAPAIGAVSAGAAWTALTWAGIGIDSPWPWLSALVVPAAVAYPVTLVLARRRTERDAAEKTRLGIG